MPRQTQPSLPGARPTPTRTGSTPGSGSYQPRGSVPAGGAAGPVSRPTNYGWGNLRNQPPPGTTPTRAPTPNVPKPNPASPLRGTNWSLGQPRIPTKPGGISVPVPTGPKIPRGAVGAAVAAAQGGLLAGDALRRVLADNGYNDFSYPSNAGALLSDPLGTLRDGWRGWQQSWSQPQSPTAPAPVGEAPFTGGQSAGVTYRIDVLYTSFSTEGNPCFANWAIIPGPMQGVSYLAVGPISGISLANNPGAGSFVDCGWAAPSRTIPRTQAVLRIGAAALNQLNTVTGGLTPIPLQDGRASLNLGGLSLSPVTATVSIARSDGQPDTGGNRPAPAAPGPIEPPPYRLPSPPPADRPAPIPNGPGGLPAAPAHSLSPRPGGPPPNRQPDRPIPQSTPSPTPRPGGPSTAPAQPTEAPNRGPVRSPAELGSPSPSPFASPSPMPRPGETIEDTPNVRKRTFTDPNRPAGESWDPVSGIPWGAVAAAVPLIPFDWSSTPAQTFSPGWGAPIPLTKEQRDEFDKTGKLPDPRTQLPQTPQRDPSGGRATAPAPALRPAPTPAPALQPAPTPSPNPDPTPNPNPSGDICQSPCIQAIGSGVQGAKQGVDDANALLRKIAAVVGAEPAQFPAQLPLLNGASGGSISNLPELMLWQTKAIDSAIGKFPADITLLNGKGEKKTVRVENSSHALQELIAGLLPLQEDADASVQMLTRLLAESVQIKIATYQSTDLIKAFAKWVGFATKRVVRTAKISVTPSAKGIDGYLDNAEMEDFLKPSSQKYIGAELAEAEQLLPLTKRWTENLEIARLALSQRIRGKGGKLNMPGERMKADKERTKVFDSELEKLKKELEEKGFEVDIKKTKKGP